MIDVTLSTDGDTLTVTSPNRITEAVRKPFEVTVTVGDETTSFAGDEEVSPRMVKAVTVSDSRPQVTWRLVSDNDTTAVYSRL